MSAPIANTLAITLWHEGDVCVIRARRRKEARDALRRIAAAVGLAAR